MMEKPERPRRRKHREAVAKHPCCVCGADNGTIIPHHLMFVQPKAMRLKAGDQWVVPLCHGCHLELHAIGDEGLFWAFQGVDPVPIAERLWRERDGQG